jgi:hypothetical protein
VSSTQTRQITLSEMKRHASDSLCLNPTFSNLSLRCKKQFLGDCLSPLRLFFKFRTFPCWVKPLGISMYTPLCCCSSSERFGMHKHGGIVNLLSRQIQDYAQYEHYPYCLPIYNWCKSLKVVSSFNLSVTSSAKLSFAFLY